LEFKTENSSATKLKDVSGRKNLPSCEYRESACPEYTLREGKSQPKKNRICDPTRADTAPSSERSPSQTVERRKRRHPEKKRGSRRKTTNNNHVGLQEERKRVLVCRVLRGGTGREARSRRQGFEAHFLGPPSGQSRRRQRGKKQGDAERTTVTKLHNEMKRRDKQGYTSFLMSTTPERGGEEGTISRPIS